jgi:lipid-A-disaccharide synthase-like uncharacterized protein
VKWEPFAAMALVLLLGLWLVLGPVKTFHHIDTRPGAETRRVLIAGSRGVVETAPDPITGEPSFRVLFRDGWESPVLSAVEFRGVFGDEVYRRCVGGGENWLFRALNITSWVSLAWVAVGLAGQLAFSGRMLVQWLLSEHHGRSVVPASFWWLSLAGGVALFAYFAWRQDLVGVLGQSTGIVVYARNLRLISKQQRRDARAADAAPQPTTPAL